MTVKETSVQVLEKLFEEHFGSKPETVSPLPVSGSDRRYFRLSNKTQSAIGTYNNNVAENNSFFYFTELFKKHKINVPEIYKTGKDRRHYLQQDLGGYSLFDQLMKEGQTESVKLNYHKSLAQLARIHWVAGREADYNQCFSVKQFEETAIAADFQYFKYYFADLQKVLYDKVRLSKEIEDISKDLGRIQPKTLMYRDFQSRNIILYKDDVYFIDYQGCMQGPPQYDIASLLWQAKAQLPAKWKEELLNGYISSMNDLPVARMDEMYLRKGYAQFIMLRLVQVLGAYGFRGLIERKPHFLSSIGPALKNLDGFLEDYHQIPAYPELRSLLERLCSAEMQEKYTNVHAEAQARLIVHINSFSYKKGLPKDESGHGGGYIFDCRGLYNPGRIDKYKKLSGLDEPVKQFLQLETKMPEFLDHVYSLASINVEDYLKRDFESLSISFGCTGGQHRSVYAAEQLASYLKAKYGVKTEVNHQNRANWVI